MKTVLIQIFAEEDTTTFDIYTDSDSYITPIHYNVSKMDLEVGYTSNIIPDDASIIKVTSNSTLCPDQYILLQITTTTTTTTTTITPEIPIEFIPDLDGSWTLTNLGYDIDIFESSRNKPLCTSIYNNNTFQKGPINTSIIQTDMGILVNISRYYLRININDIINNGITDSNINNISLKVYLESPVGINTILDLYEGGKLLVYELSRYRLYIENGFLISYPNIMISTINVNESGYYTFLFNSYGIDVIKQRILNNDPYIVLSIVTRYDSNNTPPPIVSDDDTISNINITYNSNMVSDDSKKTRLNITLI